MRDVVAAIAAVVLLLTALSLATTLKRYRRRRQRARDSERALGRTIIAEVPTADDLVLFSEDQFHFYYGKASIDKGLIMAVRVLINGAPIAVAVSNRHAQEARPIDAPDVIDDRPEGIARDRWDVAIDAVNGSLVVGCGAIRERVSQELARAVFAAVRRAIEESNESR